MDLKDGLYTLAQDTVNPKPDRRSKDRWGCWPVWPAGMEFSVRHYQRRNPLYEVAVQKGLQSEVAEFYTVTVLEMVRSPKYTPFNDTWELPPDWETRSADKDDPWADFSQKVRALVGALVPKGVENFRNLRDVRGWGNYSERCLEDLLDKLVATNRVSIPTLGEAMDEVEADWEKEDG